MSKKLAIKGHPTRGNEVIELLEMMGGIVDNIRGNVDEQFYYIHENGFIHTYTPINNYPNDNDFCKFTLEEFLEKYPFKVGDKVLIPEYESEVRICKMRWDSLCSYMDYIVYRNDDEEWYTAEELLDYNDNPNEINKDMEEKKINQMSLANCDLDEVEIVLGDKFELKTKDGKYYAVRKKSKYPTTYKECCKIVNACPTIDISYDSNEDMLYNDEVDLTLLALRKLLICRNAYWKIAGEEMGLSKPWEPAIQDTIWGITRSKDEVEKYSCHYGKTNLLEFPTEEMRDAFYENFKDLIEKCKELL